MPYVTKINYVKIRETVTDLNTGSVDVREWVRTDRVRHWIEPGETEAARYFKEIEEMKRKQREVTKPGKWAVPQGEPLFAGLTELLREMTDAFWDDGKPRETSTISIRLGVDSCQVSLNNKEEMHSITTNATTVQEALQGIETALNATNPPWRTWGKQKR